MKKIQVSGRKMALALSLHESNPSVAADRFALPGVDLWLLEPQPPRLGKVKTPAALYLPYR